MRTDEDTDTSCVVIRRNYDGGWRVESAGQTTTLVCIVTSQTEALSLARQLDPRGLIRICPPIVAARDRAMYDLDERLSASVA